MAMKLVVMVVVVVVLVVVVVVVHPCPKGRNPSAETCPKFCFRESLSVSEISIL